MTGTLRPVGEDEGAEARPAAGHPLAAVVIGGAGPVLRLIDRPAAAALLVVAAGATVAVIAAVRPGARARWLLGGAGLVALALTAATAWHRAEAYGWLAATAASAVAALVLVAPWRRLRPTLLAVGPIVAAGVSWAHTGDRGPFVALLGLAVVIAGASLVRPAPFAVVERAVDRGAKGIGRMTVAVSATAAWLIGVLPAWAWTRASGRDLLDPGWASDRSAWITVAGDRVRGPDGRPVAPGRTALVEVRPATRRRGGRLRLAVPVLVLAVVAALVWRPSLRPWRHQPARQPDTFTRPFEQDPAFADAPWAKDLRVDLLDAWQGLEFNAASGGWRLRDVASEYVNVTDGERRTIAPDPALGRPLQVWLLGGSAAFGAGQRDDHTIASELVRRAGADGIALAVHNLAVPATVDWQSAVLLEQLLAWRAPPDLIVVYDGANDLILQDVLIQRGLGASDEPASIVDGQIDDILRARAAADGRAAGALAESARPSKPDPTPDPATAGAHVATRYGRGIALMRRTAAAADVPLAVYWQPDLRSKQPLSAADHKTLATVGADHDLDRWQRFSGAARAGLAAEGVVDLTTVFDGLDDALYWDTVHTNERGAEVVAAALWAHLRDQVAAIAAG